MAIAFCVPALPGSSPGTTGQQAFALSTPTRTSVRHSTGTTGLDPQKMETNIVICRGRAYTKMASFTAAMKSLGWPWKALTVLDLLPRRLTDWTYDRIAQNRYRLGRRTCPLPSAALKERLLD